jgi:hypothetical protein
MAKRPRSEAQRAASRANGRRSSGPKSTEGKSRSRRNALRHGLRAASLEVLPQNASLPAAMMVEAVREKLTPRDVIEAEYVDGIAMAFWRLRRARQLEEALLAGGQLQRGETGLAKALLKRTDPAGALALLLRYRNQALGELDRLVHLLEAHRCNNPGTIESAADGAAPTSAAAPAANDNRAGPAVQVTPPPDRPLS